MSKKSNTVMFILAATVLNVVLTIVLFLGLMVLYSAVIRKFIPDTVGWSVMVSFILSLAGSFLVYRLLLKLLAKKIDFDKYFDPLFVPKRR